MKRFIIGLVFCLIPFFSIYAFTPATEKILNFDAKIKINTDSSIYVRETIHVNAQGKKIKRGIFRDIPTKYKDKYGNNVNLDLRVISVYKNGQPEPYHIQDQNNGIRIYVGKQNTFLDHGYYTYEIVYQVKFALGYFENHDELYWNITGNGWLFTIDKATATIELPYGAKLLQHAGYTGFKNSTEQNFIAIADNNKIEFETTKALSSTQGLTIAVGWPKGFVTEPSQSDKVVRLLKENVVLLYSLGFAIILTLYYLAFWSILGRDPKKGTIIPLFDPPKDFSPAMTQYVANMRFNFSNTAFTAALINMAVKGFIKIDSNKNDFSIEKLKPTDKSLGLGERVIFKKLFALGDSFEFKQKNAVEIQRARSEFRKKIKTELNGLYFVNNRLCFVMALFLTIIFLFGLFQLLPDSSEAGFMLIWLSGWTLGVVFLVALVYASWKSYFSNDSSIFAALGITLFSLPFIGGEIIGISILAADIGLLSTLCLVLVICLHFLFLKLLKRPTIMGRKIMDQVDGFKMYLKTAEHSRYESFKGPELSPEIFEKNLPYAIALGLENEWCDQFAHSINQADISDTHSSYNPSWYSGHSSFQTLGAAGFATAIGSTLSSSISSASTSPGSSSGFGGSGGGGSSGGGGGGGGGGGW